MKIFVTGGSARQLVTYMDVENHFVPDLVLAGVLAIGEKLA